jgi:two-component system, OmpR family, phosphate regulon sensor histidine kinase PhoR
MQKSGSISTGGTKSLKHSGWQLLLLAIPILFITGFQLFWLQENFRKEKKNLEFRSNVVFRESVKKLQAKKLNLDKVFDDSTGSMQFAFTQGGPPFHPGPEELAGTLNDVTIRVKDSMLRISTFSPERRNIVIENEKNIPGPDSVKTKRPKGLVISMSESFTTNGKDSMRELNFQRRGRPGEIIRFLYGVDSLQDSLRVKEVDSVCRLAFAKQGLQVPFIINKNDSVFFPDRIPPNEERMNKVTIGFAHPVTFELKLGNSFNYLAKKLASPILFSVFLVSITILSFVLLYKNLLRQRRLTEIKNEFISNITHELKTPIATVGVAIEALKNFNAINDPQRTREYLDISQNELQRLSLLVDKVLKLSMFEKKEIELKHETLDLKAVVEEVVSSMKLQIEKYGATVSVNTNGDTNLRGDKLHFLSVVFNLLDNALKYGNANTAVKFELSGNEKEVMLSVADNGIGISPMYKDKVFEKFFRVPSGDTHNTKGYGLGLSYVAHVIQKHKGKIELESQPGLGTKFIITLPKTPIS